MIYFVLVLALVVYAIEQWSLSTALKGIEFNHRPSQTLLEPGEEFEVITEIKNSSRRLVPFIKIEEYLPPEMNVMVENAVLRVDQSKNMTFSTSLYLLPKKVMVRKFSVTLPRRGRYFLRGAKLKGGDFLGISEETMVVSLLNEMVVIPEAIEVPDIVQVLGGFLGDVSVRRFIMEDPVLTVGHREYTGREPMKSISWQQSARLGRLMVKQYDHTLEPAVTVLLDVNYTGENKGDYIETCFSLTRTVCSVLEDKGIKYDFVTNATSAGAFSLFSSISEGLGRKHFYTILEGLGRATYDATESFSETVERAAGRQEGNRSTIIITPKKTDETLYMENFLRNRCGGEVLSICAEEAVE